MGKVLCRIDHDIFGALFGRRGRALWTASLRDGFDNSEAGGSLIRAIKLVDWIGLIGHRLMLVVLHLSFSGCVLFW